MDSNTEQWKLERGEDGRLIANGWHGFACQGCGSYHIELLDDDGKVFAAMTIDGDDLVEMGQMLLAFAATLALNEAINDTGSVH